MSTSPTLFNAQDSSAPGHYPPSQTALLLLDFHVAFVQQAAGENGSEAARIAVIMRKWAHSVGITVVYGIVDVNDEPFPTLKDTQRLQIYLNSLRLAGGEEVPELCNDPTENEATFKRMPGIVSALKSPGMEEFLRKKGIQSLLLCGLSTSGCLMRTAIAATDAQFVVTVIADGCADRDQELHEVVLHKILPTRAHVSTAAEFEQGYASAIGRT
jgi:nicotinamidase-related amidase